MAAEQIQSTKSADSRFFEKFSEKSQNASEKDFGDVIREKRKKNKSVRKQESWFDKRQKRIRARLKAQAVLAAIRQGEMSRIEQENHAKAQEASANRLHNFLTEDAGMEKRMPERAEEKRYDSTGNTYEHLRKAYIFSGRRKVKSMTQKSQ